MMRRLLFVVAFAGVSARGVLAQGALAVQGFGYPTGQLGAAALAVGGGTAEVDPASALNPAATGLASRYSLYMQFEPEYRRTTIGGASATSSSMRFPGFVTTGSVGRFTAGASFTTLLDRTWVNTYSDSQIVGGQMLPSTLRAASVGAIADARFSLSYWMNAKLQLGAGVHAISGENRIEFGRVFPDSTGVGSVAQTSTINYSGRAFSLGALVAPVKQLLIGASARFGGPIAAHQDGVLVGEANVPARFGLGAAWFGIPNTTLSARLDRTAWSSMRGLGSAQVSVFDATEIGLGVDVVGPPIAGAPSVARLGLRSRNLPFGANGDQVSERSVAGGLGVPIGKSRAVVDLTLQRAVREGAGASERAWFVSIGFGIRP